MAQVGRGACSSAPPASVPSACSSGCQLWRPAQEVLQFLTECALPPPLHSPHHHSSHPNLLTASSAVAAVSSKRPPPARWEPPAQMKIMRPAVSSELPADATPVCGEESTEKALTCQDLSPKPSVGSNSPCSKSDGFVQAASSDCSQQASRAVAIDIWQFPRPSKIPTCSSEQHLPPPHRARGNSKCDTETVSSRTNPKESNAFARVACSESSSWAVGFLTAERVQSSPVSIKTSGFEACAAHNNSFEAFASRRQDDVISKDAQRFMESFKSENAAKSMPNSADVNASTPFSGVQGNLVSAQIEGSMPIQSESTNAVSENDESAALDLLVNAIRAASSVAAKNSIDHEKEAGVKNSSSDNSSKAQKLSYFVHGCVPFTQKRITRRAKSSYQKRQTIYKDNSDIVTLNPLSDATPAGCHKIRIRTTLEDKAQQYADRFQDQEISKSMHSPEKKAKQTAQQHRSLEAILFGYDSPIVQSRRGRTQYGDVMSSTIKKSRSRNLRRSSDIWRFHD